MLIANIIKTDNSKLPINIQTGSISRTLSDATAKLSLSAVNMDEYYPLQDIEIEYSGENLFKGKIQTQSDGWSGTKVSSLEAFDYLHISNNRIVAEIYPIDEGPYLITDILKDILRKYFSEITFTNISDTILVTVDELIFEYETLLSCIQKLAEIADAYFYIDNDLDIHFFQNNDGIASINYGTHNIMPETIEVSSEATNLTNRIWLFGAKQASSISKTEYFTLDGKNRLYKLAYEPNNMEVYIDGTIQTLLPEQDDDGEVDFLYNKGEKVLIIPERTSVPLSGELKAIYQPTIQITEYFEDMDSINQYGLYEKAVKDKSISSKMAARKRARTALSRTSKNKRIVSFETSDWNISIGKIISINVPQMNIDSNFLITDITLNLNINHITASITAEELMDNG